MEDEEMGEGESSSGASKGEYEDCYNMNHKNRGIALIFNHENFDISTGWHKYPRTGTGKDRDKFEITLKKLRFDVTVRDNFTYDEIMTELKNTANLEHSEFDCVFVAVMTHGNTNKLGAKDTKYKPDELWKYFTAMECPQLAGKPKIFCIQACTGKTVGKGVTMKYTSADGPSPTYELSKLSEWINLREKDFLVVNASAPGFFSYRDENYGTWFVQSLCDGLSKLLGPQTGNCQEDILETMSHVIRNVAENYGDGSIKQIPCFMSTLTRTLLL
jgi:caspase 7